MSFEYARKATYLASITIGTLLLGIDSSSAAGAQSNQMLLRGPVDKVNALTSQIEVLGQWVSARGMPVEALEGHVVSVNGVIGARGAYVVSGIQSLSSVHYVPGATSVFLTGIISSINKSIGVLVLSGVSVDYTGALHTLMAEDLAVGIVASFSGLRYSDPKKIYAADGVVVGRGVVGTDGAVGTSTLKVRG
ncbi:MAG: hypothetical protein ACLPV8_09670, partial [Steroidobacteraceae bacterium]